MVLQRKISLQWSVKNEANSNRSGLKNLIEIYFLSPRNKQVWNRKILNSDFRIHILIFWKDLWTTICLLFTKQCFLLHEKIYFQNFIPYQVFSVVGSRCALFFPGVCRPLQRILSASSPSIIDTFTTFSWLMSRDIENIAEILMIWQKFI